MKNSQKGFAPIVILIIIAAVAIGGGTYVYTKQKSQTPAATTETSVVATTTNNVDKSKETKVSTEVKPQPAAQVSITVLSPNGGEKLVMGNSQKITWKTSANFPYPQVKISVINEKGQAVGDSLTTNNTGSYTLTIPTTLTVGGKYKIRIEGSPFTGGMAAQAPFDESNTYVIADRLRANSTLSIVNQTDSEITYKSTEYGFEFTIPASYRREIPTDSGPYADTLIFLGRDSNNKQFTISLAKKMSLTSPVNVTVGNRTAEKYITQGDVCMPAQNYQLTVKDSHSNDQNMNISFYGGSCVKERLVQSEVDSILASFKFTR